MVCDKLAGVEHDFEKDGLDLIVKRRRSLRKRNDSRSRQRSSGCPYDDSS